MLCVAADSTKNFSGAEIEGLVKSATSFALNRQVDVNDLSKPIDEDNLKVSQPWRPQCRRAARAAPAAAALPCLQQSREP